MGGSAESGAETQLALLGPQDYQTWLAHSDMYPRSYSYYFPDHPWHAKMWRSAARAVPTSNPQTKEAVLWGLVGGVAILAVVGIVVVARKK